MHAPSLIRYRLGRKCTKFTADIGVDDESPGGKGSVTFEVWADGEKIYPTGAPASASDAGDGLLIATSPAKHIEVDVSNRRELRLLVTTGGNGDTGDHADWADARVLCAP